MLFELNNHYFEQDVLTIEKFANIDAGKHDHESESTHISKDVLAEGGSSQCEVTKCFCD